MNKVTVEVLHFHPDTGNISVPKRYDNIAGGVKCEGGIVQFTPNDGGATKSVILVNVPVRVTYS